MKGCLLIKLALMTIVLALSPCCHLTPEYCPQFPPFSDQFTSNFPNWCYTFVIFVHMKNSENYINIYTCIKASLSFYGYLTKLLLNKLFDFVFFPNFNFRLKFSWWKWRTYIKFCKIGDFRNFKVFYHPRMSSR